MKHIVLTGGGTAGHVTPNIALHWILRRNRTQTHRRTGNSLLRNLLRKIKTLLRSEKLFRPLPRPQRISRSKKTPQETETRYHLFQRRIRHSSCCYRSKTLQNSGNYPRI